MIRVFLVDDEPPARRKLRRLIAEDPDFEIAGEAGSGAAAVEGIVKLLPDLVFLDISLPDCTGFDVVDSLPAEKRPQIIFVTAHDDFALKAFEVHALDYVLKPVEPTRFTETLKRAKRLVQPDDAAQIAGRLNDLVAQLRTSPNRVARLLIQEEDRSFFIDVGHIDWIESARNYACVHVAGKTHILRSTLESLELKLDGERFRRINRSEIINVDRILEIRNWFHGDQKVILKDGTELMWSRRYRAGSLEELERSSRA